MATMTMVQTRTGTGTYTLTDEEAADYQGLEIVSLSGRQGFSSGALVYGFGPASATGTTTRTGTGSYTSAQTRTETGTQTRTQTRQQKKTRTQNKQRISTNAGKKPFFLRHWWKKWRRKRLPIAKKTKANNSKSENKPTEEESRQPKTQNPTRSRITTIRNVADGPPAPDPGDPGGSATATSQDDAGQKKQQKQSPRKSRVTTVGNVATESPAPDPGDPGGNTTVRGLDDSDSEGKDSIGDEIIPLGTNNVKDKKTNVGFLKKLLRLLRVTFRRPRAKKD